MTVYELNSGIEFDYVCKFAYLVLQWLFAPLELRILTSYICNYINDFFVVYLVILFESPAAGRRYFSSEFDYFPFLI